jgi:hypothetical protein
LLFVTMPRLTWKRARRALRFLSALIVSQKTASQRGGSLVSARTGRGPAPLRGFVALLYIKYIFWYIICKFSFEMIDIII